MIRLIQRRLIIPRGDTGSFSIPVLRDSTDNIAVFTIFDEVTQTKIFQKKVKSEDGIINIAFTHADTVNLKPGEYVWDIKYYSNPEYIDDELVNGEEIDSYYAGFSLPVCEIRETADNYLVSPDGPDAKLSPEQLEIVTGAIHSLNEAIRKTQENVEHYPEIRNEIWYVWDAELGDYVSTDVRANGIVGNGIASAVLNDDYTLTLNFTDGTSFTSPSIRGQRGNGIEDIVLNNDFTLTITYTDGDSYVTPSIRGPVGATPQFSIGTVQDGAVAAASITGTAENPVLNLTLPNAHVPTRVSQLENDSGYLTQEIDPTVPQWAKESTKPSYTPQEVGALPADTYIPQNTSDLTNDSNYAVDANYVHTDNNYTTVEKNKLSGIAAGAEVNVNADWNANSGDAQILNKPTKVSDFTNDAGYLTEHQDISGKADKSEIPIKVSQLQNDSGYLTSFTETDPTVPAWAKAAQKPTYTAAEVGAPTVAEMNTAIGTAIGQINSFDIAVVQELPTQDISTHTIYLVPKTGETNDVYDEYVYINNNWEMVGNTQIDLSNYALKSELPTKVSELSNDSGYLTSYTETDPTVPQWAKANTKPSYTAAEVGALPSDTHIPSTTAELTNDAGFITVEDIPEVPVQDVQVNGTSILDAQGVANVPMASASEIGAVGINSSGGVDINASTGKLRTSSANGSQVRNGTDAYKPIVPYNQHNATFYGLAKAAGDTTQSQSTNTVGTYTSEAKGAIQQMLGVSDLIAPAENNLVASKAYAIGDVFTANGKLYKATAAIAINDTIVLQNSGETVSGANAIESNVGEGFPHDVQINDVSIVENGVANVPIASKSSPGVVKVNTSFGTAMRSSPNEDTIMVYKANSDSIKWGTQSYMPIVPFNQHESTFYGLAKAAGADEKESTLSVGQYTDTAKTAIRSMIGATSSNVIAVQDTQPTDTDTKIWLPETAETPVEVPTVAEMNAALAGKVGDVQVEGTSIVSNGIASLSKANATTYGLVKTQSGNTGVYAANDGTLYLATATDAQMKSGSGTYPRAITPGVQNKAVFYGLAKAAGDTTQSQSDNAVGTYTDDAKSAIQTMLGIDLSSIASQVEIPLVETVEGAAVTITGQPNTRYMCGEVTSISITPPAAGSIDVVFTSGSTVAVLTLPSTVKMPEWFDATTLDANTVYEILITDGVYGSVMTWAT